MTETAILNLAAWSLQVAVLTLAAAALACLIRIDAPAVRYMWWRVVLLACLALPLVQPWQPLHLAPVDPTTAQEAPVAPPAGAVLVSSPAAPPPSAPARLPHWSTIAAAVLALGAVVRLAWLAAGLARLRRIRQRGVPAVAGPDDDIFQALVDAGADVRFEASLGQPVTFGVRHPAVLLPASLASMSAGVRRAVMAHELWHVRRRDWPWSLAEEAVCALLWFHPAVWYLVSRVQSAREEVVDELAVLTTNQRRSYLEALLTFAEEPAVYPAAPFIRRRQLFNRMLLISKEGVMSSKRIIASSAAMAGALALAGWYGVHAFPLMADTAMVPARGSAQQPRDPRPAEARPSTSREAELKTTTAANPSDVKSWLELAKLQEDRGATDEAEQTLRSALAATGSLDVAMGLAGFFNRQGNFPETMRVLEDVAAQHPTDAFGHQMVATYYWEKAQKDHRLTPAEKLHYIESGISATDRAIAQNPDYIEALTYKNILLRMKGNMQTNAAARQQFYDEANTLRNRAMELSKARAASGQQPSAAGPIAEAARRSAGTPPPPPPPPAPPSPPQPVDGVQPVRIGGNIKAPTKIHHVNPEYPQEALDARVSGVVIVEAMVDAQGDVRSAKVLRSIPLLDQAAIDAVEQWRFEPTFLNGQAVPVIMTVTVNFTVQ